MSAFCLTVSLLDWAAAQLPTRHILQAHRTSAWLWGGACTCAHYARLARHPESEQVSQPAKKLLDVWYIDLYERHCLFLLPNTKFEKKDFSLVDRWIAVTTTGFVDQEDTGISRRLQGQKKWPPPLVVQYFLHMQPKTLMDMGMGTTFWVVADWCVDDRNSNTLIYWIFKNISSINSQDQTQCCGWVKREGSSGWWKLTGLLPPLIVQQHTVGLLLVASFHPWQVSEKVINSRIHGQWRNLTMESCRSYREVVEVQKVNQINWRGSYLSAQDWTAALRYS